MAEIETTPVAVAPAVAAPTGNAIDEMLSTVEDSKAVQRAGGTMVTVGRTYAWVGLIMTVIVSAVMLVIAYHLYNTQKNFTIPGTGMVTNATTHTVSDGQGGESTVTTVSFSYSHDGKNYSAHNQTYPGVVSVGSTVDIMISATKPSLAEAPSSNKTIAYVIAGVGVFMTVVAAANLYATYYSKWYAGLYGAEQSMQTLRDL